MLGGPVHLPEDAKFYFTCNISGYAEQTVDDGSRFEVIFMADGEDVGNAVTLNATYLEARLYDADLSGKAGTSVRIYQFAIKCNHFVKANQTEGHDVGEGVGEYMSQTSDGVIRKIRD